MIDPIARRLVLSRGGDPRFGGPVDVRRGDDEALYVAVWPSELGAVPDAAEVAAAAAAIEAERPGVEHAERLAAIYKAGEVYIEAHFKPHVLAIMPLWAALPTAGPMVQAVTGWRMQVAGYYDQVLAKLSPLPAASPDLYAPLGPPPHAIQELFAAVTADLTPPPAP